jgi:hypothetical protein
VPAFIISCERSGSTLLRFIVDTHPDIASPGELHLGELCRNLQRTISRTLGEAATYADAGEKDRAIRAEVRKSIDVIMEAYVAAKHKRMWCEKTTMNLYHIDIVQAVFPDAKYICLYRNALDQVHSCIETGRLGFMPEHIAYVHRSPDNIVGALVENWIDRTNELLAFERAHAAQCFRVKYESLILDPPGTLQPLFEFLGVAWQPQLLDSVFSAHHDEGDGDAKVRFADRIYTNTIGKGSTINRDHVPARMLDEMNRLLAALDYPIVGPDWDTMPSPYRTIAVAPAQRKTLSCVKDIFTEYLPRRLDEARNDLQGRSVVYKVVVTGEGGGSWIIDLTGSDHPLIPSDGSADCTITVAADDLIDIVNGDLNAAESFLQGRLHIAGDLLQAEGFGRLLFQG